MANLSVIVPIYNASKYLDRCISSIADQTYKDLEIILVDDGSTDNSLDICKSYAEKDNRIKVIHKSNGGQSSARNTGLDYSTSKYITFVDSDDYLAPKMYEIMMSHNEDGNNYELLICDNNEVSEDQSPTFVDYPTYPKILPLNQLWEEIFVKLNNAVWNKIYLRDIIGALRFPTNIPHGEDLLFNLQYLQRCKQGLFFDIKLYNYVQRKDSITGCSFSDNKVFEITSKDLAFEIIEKTHPVLISTAIRYKFRSRLNVLRAIYSSKLENEKKTQVDDIENYLMSNIGNHWKHLTIKDRIEYFLLTNFKQIYKRIIRIK